MSNLVTESNPQLLESVRSQYDALTKAFVVSAVKELNRYTDVSISLDLDVSEADKIQLHDYASRIGQIFDNPTSIINPNWFLTDSELAKMSANRTQYGADFNLANALRYYRKVTPEEVKAGSVGPVPTETVAKMYSAMQEIEDPRLRQVIDLLPSDLGEFDRLINLQTTDNTEEPLNPLDMVSRDIISQVLIINYLVRNPDQTFNQIIDLFDFPLIIARYYDLLDKDIPNSTLRHYVSCNNFLAEHTVGLEEELIAEKQPAQLPSKRLQYSVQIPAYKEMPSNEQEVQQNPRGNLGELLMSGFIAAERHYTNHAGTDAGDIEFLINVNNKPGEVPLGNKRSLTLVSALKESDTVEQFLNQLDWVTPAESGPSQFYSLLYTRFRSLQERGLQLHVLDLTDGQFIRRNDIYSESTSIPTQGGRRRLISSIAMNRFSSSEINPNQQVMCFLDGDCRLDAQYFLELEKTYRSTTKPQVTNSLVRLSREVGGNVIATEEVSRGFLITQALIAVMKMVSEGGHNRNSISPSPATFTVNASAYRNSGGWDYMKQMYEDSAFLSVLLFGDNQLEYIDKAITTIVDRERPESWLGGSTNDNRSRLRDLPKEKYYSIIAQHDSPYVAKVLTAVEAATDELLQRFNLNPNPNLDVVTLMSELISPNSTYAFTPQERDLLKRFAKDTGKYNAVSSYPDISDPKLNTRSQVFPLFNRMTAIGLNLIQLDVEDKKHYLNLFKMFKIIQNHSKPAWV